MKNRYWLMVFIGIAIALSPLLGQLYTSYKQQQLLSGWEDILDDETDESIKQQYHSLQSLFGGEAYEAPEVIPEIEGLETVQFPNTSYEETSPGTVSVSSPSHPSGTREKKSKKTSSQEVMGVLRIAKLDVKVPIVNGVKADNLKVGVGYIPGTASIGEIGNTAIAGHRSYTFGKFFNRLDELDIGDKIEIYSNGQTYEYTVYKKHIVDPTDLSVLNRNDTDKVLTLITCHPIYIASHRLIVHAVIES